MSSEKSVGDLPHDEQLALAGLLRRVVMAGGDVSEAEAQGLSEIADAIGAEAYAALMDEAATRFTNEEELQAFLAAIENQESREMIYGLVLMEAGFEGVNASEADLLAWLAMTWKITMETEDFQP
jgi:uncharacterized tellurite resistance protein B-like protein